MCPHFFHSRSATMASEPSPPPPGGDRLRNSPSPSSSADTADTSADSLLLPRPSATAEEAAVVSPNNITEGNSNATADSTSTDRRTSTPTTATDCHPACRRQCPGCGAKGNH
uniref:Uncharacterized protein n=1 Tax=Minutocellus polymorphus TaxID=265543 RepID=A0A7S0AZT5_9STRA